MSITDSQQKSLFLVRHGDAVEKEQDPDRPLNEQGRQAVERIASWATAAGVRPDEILHSGKLRAAQTAEILAAQLQPARGTARRDGLNPNDDVATIAEWVADADATVMLVGHLPFLGRLVAQLVVGDADCNVVQFAAGGLVALVREDDEWVIAYVVDPGLMPSS
jgi:phosphohistidine phosphatase